MKLSCVKNISFKGVASPFINKDGYNIIPISKIPKQEEIDNATGVAKTETELQA